MAKRRTSVTLPSDTYQWLMQMAEREDISPAAAVTRCIGLTQILVGVVMGEIHLDIPEPSGEDMLPPLPKQRTDITLSQTQEQFLDCLRCGDSLSSAIGLCIRSAKAMDDRYQKALAAREAARAELVPGDPNTLYKPWEIWPKRNP